ncbi:TPA: RNA-binding domain-containing protein [Streptococcus suis]
MYQLVPESRYIEYKAARDNIPDDLWETYSAFANTQGGKIILGVSEPKKGRYDITGVVNPEKRIEKFWQLVTNPQKVNKNILREDDVKILEMDGKSVIEISIPEASYSQKPIYIKGHKELCYRRIGEEDKKATEEEYKYMVVNSHDGIDNTLLPSFDIEDLNTIDVINYRALLIESTGDKKYANMDIPEFLINLGAMKRDRNDQEKPYKLTMGGLLFFGKYNSIIDYFPNFQLDYFKKASSLDTDWQDRVSTGDKDYPELNIFSFYVKVMDKLIQSIDTKFSLTKNMTRDSYLADMSRAIREALTNALVHAYYGANEPIKILNYDDYWEFSNPGDMKVSKEEFIHGGNSRVRNSVISILFRRVGYVERAGSGGPRIFDATSKYRLKIPDIHTTDRDTKIRIWKFEPMNYYTSRTDDEKMLLTNIFETGTITKGIALDDLKMTEYSFRNAIKTLLDDNIIKQVGKSRNTRYVLPYSNEAYIQSRKKWLVEINDVLKNS